MRKTYNIIIAVISGILAVICGYFFAQGSLLQDFSVVGVGALYVVLLISSVPVIDVCHEAAHFVVGNILGMGVRVPKISIFSSSYVELNPRTLSGLKWKMCVTSLAGLLVDLILIAIALWAIIIRGIPIELALILPYAFYQFMINIVPFEDSDTGVVVDVMKNTDSSKVMLAVLSIQAKINRGASLEDIEESELFDLPQLPEDNIYFIILTELRYEYYTAKGDKEKALPYLERYESLKQYM